MRSEISQLNRYHISGEHLLFVVCIFLLLPAIGSQAIRLYYKSSLHSGEATEEDEYYFVYSAWLRED